MKNKLNLNKLLNLALGYLYRLRSFLIVLIVVGLVGYAGYLASQIISIQPDQAYLSTQRQQLSQSKVNFDKSTIQTINSLVQLNPQVDLTNIGKSDPFSP